MKLAPLSLSSETVATPARKHVRHSERMAAPESKMTLKQFCKEAAGWGHCGDIPPVP
jgi:hypothetical protein